ncbi:MAG: hypothetical protein AAGC81_13355 [Pseudomonadota bacterium]
MDIAPRSEIAGVLAKKSRDTLRLRSRFRVIAQGRDHRIMELSAEGFVIEADGRPPLRGYVEIFDGDERVDRRLVLCDWARDGLVGYEFKRDGAGNDVPTDYVPSVIAGLIEGPER